jgi:hypothetical protein
MGEMLLKSGVSAMGKMRKMLLNNGVSAMGKMRKMEWKGKKIKKDE